MRRLAVPLLAGSLGLAALGACQPDPDAPPVVFESEPNGTAATADLIPPEVLVKGVLLPGDVDVFDRGGAGGSYLSCSLSHPEVWGDVGGQGVVHLGTCDDELLVGFDTQIIELRGVGPYVLRSVSA
jgi:hypothetical protein